MTNKIQQRKTLFEVTVKSEMWGDKPIVSFHVSKDSQVTPDTWKALRDCADDLERIYTEE